MNQFESLLYCNSFQLQTHNILLTVIVILVHIKGGKYNQLE